MNNKRAFYLKINRRENLAISNLSRWIDAAYLSEADCYIVCDKEDLVKRIKDELFPIVDIVYLKSIKSEEARYLVKNIASENWEAAAYAHLTTFMHANEMQYEYFWNIDADDTMICLSAERIQEMLRCVEKYAEAAELDVFSLDMGKSRNNAWTLGIAYMSGKLDWLKTLTRFCMDSEYKAVNQYKVINIDAYIEYQKMCGHVKAESFYFENLRFAHYIPQKSLMYAASWLHHWRNGKFSLPIVADCLGFDELAYFDIPKEVIKFDIGIADQEATDILGYYAWDRKGYGISGDWKKVVNMDICKRKTQLFLTQKTGARHENENETEREIICFGAGGMFQAYYDKIAYFFDLKYLCDNDPGKWGKEVKDGIQCISPEQLRQKKNVFVIITTRVQFVEEIKHQLSLMGIDHYASVYSWLRCMNKMHEIRQ